MADAPAPIADDDRQKAKKFFDRGSTVAETGNYEFAIEMYLMGLALDPEAVDAHQALRDISLKRKVSGGKSVGMMDGMKLKRPTKDDKQNMINAEKLLAFEPGNTDYMVSILQNAHRAGFYGTARWMGPILLRANAESKSPEFSKFILIKDVYSALQMWKEAIESAHLAAQLKPNDMDLQTEIKNLSARETMRSYDKADSFTQSLKDGGSQLENISQQKDVVSEDALSAKIRAAEAEYNAEPSVEGKLIKLVEALEQTKDPENENRAIELLEDAFKRTRQFRFRQRLGKIKMAQLERMKRSLVMALKETPKDEALRKDYEGFLKDQWEFELSEFQLWSENYPSDLQVRFETGTRLYMLKRPEEAIPLFQQARMDPKLKYDAAVSLGRAFHEAGFEDEADDTLRGVIEEYPLKGDDKSKNMFYWHGRVLESKNDVEAAIKRYSQVAMWEFNYKDVQVRIKALRAKKSNPIT